MSAYRDRILDRLTKALDEAPINSSIYIRALELVEFATRILEDDNVKAVHAWRKRALDAEARLAPAMLCTCEAIHKGLKGICFAHGLSSKHTEPQRCAFMSLEGLRCMLPDGHAEAHLTGVRGE